MIDASNITDYDLNYEELEGRIIFWILAAGKNGTRAADITNRMLSGWKEKRPELTPFEVIKKFKQDSVIELCKIYATGCYNTKGRSLYEIANSGLNLRTCSAEELEGIYGIGMKTARCFIIHSRKNVKMAGLDTHMLKYLRSLGYDAPKTTPSSKKIYNYFEQVVITLAENSGESPTDFDLRIWNKYKVV